MILKWRRTQFLSQSQNAVDALARTNSTQSNSMSSPKSQRHPLNQPNNQPNRKNPPPNNANHAHRSKSKPMNEIDNACWPCTENAVHLRHHQSLDSKDPQTSNPNLSQNLKAMHRFMSSENRVKPVDPSSHVNVKRRESCTSQNPKTQTPILPTTCHHDPVSTLLNQSKVTRNPSSVRLRSFSASCLFRGT